MDRLTDKDWHTTKFMGLNEREVLHKLWELENAIESGELHFDNSLKPKYKVGDTVYFVISKAMAKPLTRRGNLLYTS